METNSLAYRAAMYTILARLLAYPDKNLKKFCRTALKIQGLQEKTKIILSKREGEKLTDIQEQYVATFNHTQSESPLYETYYTYTSPFQQASELADISGFYNAFGLKLDLRTVERADHISIQLEFMAFLLLRLSTETANSEATAVIEAAIKKFVAEHLGRWAPALGEMIRAKSESKTYSQIGAILSEFTAEEIKLLGVNPAKLRGIDSRTFAGEPEGGCFSCALNQTEGEQDEN